MKTKWILGSFLLFSAIISSQAQTIEIMEKQFENAPIRDLAIETYLRDNQLFDVKVSPEGIYYIKSKANPEGKKVNANDYVTVHYTGKLLSERIFDSSIQRGEPITFKIGIGQVIQGWDKGIPLFLTGEKGTIFIPNNLAYGDSEVGGVIPANSPLIFDIEVLETMDNATYMEHQKVLQQKIQAEAEARIAKQGAIDKSIIEQYAKDHHLKLQYLPSGLAYYMTEEGKGAQVKVGSIAVVHYTGKLLDGTKFDSSKDRNQPFNVSVGSNRVIQGWEQGLPLFKAGGKGTLIIPSTLGYGERGAGGVIAPNSVLIFDIEVLEVK
ncbi:MAG: FKBP-type peptidyl-prolyl cis-trans isomerase [Chitinophagales bacterium]|nr:FKBP-type peptidyl-prolyl cis-trans isomerase [Chitinophagales bacterium]